MVKQRSYGFLTTSSNLLEVKASSPQQAFKRAQKENKKYVKQFKKLGLMSEAKGEVTKSYLTYGRSGFAPAGIYKQVKMRKR